MKKVHKSVDWLQALVTTRCASGAASDLMDTGRRKPRNQPPLTVVCLLSPSLLCLYNLCFCYCYVVDWVRDVAWAPNTAMPYNIIASCSEDRSVLIWKQAAPGAPWQPSVLNVFDAPVWRVSWSVTGNVLAVSAGDHKVTLWKQSVDESWVQISTVGDSSAAVPAN